MQLLKPTLGFITTPYLEKARGYDHDYLVLARTRFAGDSGDLGCRVCPDQDFNGKGGARDSRFCQGRAAYWLSRRRFDTFRLFQGGRG